MQEGSGGNAASVRPADSVPITHPSGGCDSLALSHSHAPCSGTVKMSGHVSDQRNSAHHHRHSPSRHTCIPPSPPSRYQSLQD